MSERGTIPLTDVAVVTVSYNSSEILDEFLSSLTEGETTPPRVLVADNDSADVDETAAIVERHGATIVRLPQNLGYGGAINSAVRTLDETVAWILVVNPDVTFTPKAISTLVETARSTPRGGSFGPRIVDSEGQSYPSARRLPSLRTGVGHALLSRIWPANPWTRWYLHDSVGDDEPSAVGWLSGACVLVRRSAFEQMGGFDDGYFMYFEDVDLGYRLGRAGWKNLYCPNAVVTHSGAHSTTKESGRMLHAHHASAYRYLARKYSGWYLAPLRWALRLGLGARAMWLSRERPPMPPRAPKP